MKTTKFRFARKCSFTQKPMNEGYCFEDGNKYAIDEKSAKKYAESLGLNWKQELKKWDADPEASWFYWTEWEEIEQDWFYDSKGKEWTLDDAQKALTKASKNLIGAIDDNATSLWEDDLSGTADCVVMEKCTIGFIEYNEDKKEDEIIDREFTGVFEPLADLEFLTNLLA